LLPGHRLVLVSHDWHLPRARVIAAILGLPVEAGAGIRGALPWPARARAVLREGLAMPASAARAARLRLRWARRSGP
jgi:uncharacterized SAM-binding protein YcdF (DUF218 family)